jgi:mRNA-degrading endonuclease YafQ of YafQ-DinJ toxin-antitoxin module
VRPIAFTPAFNRAYKSRIRRQPVVVKKVEAVLTLLVAEPFEPSLQTQVGIGRFMDLHGGI